MNEEFLLLLREPPRREFADALYEKISQSNLAPSFFSLAVKRAALALAILVLAFGTLLALSPNVRAQIGEVLKHIGPFRFKETDQIAPMAPDAITIEGQKVSLDLARALAPYPLRVPTWAPPGFTMEKDVQIVTKEDLGLKQASNWHVPVTMVWRNSKGQAIALTQRLASGVGPMSVGRDSVQEVKVNGQPAALIVGIWDGTSGTWHNPTTLTLMWRDERVAYDLNCSPSSGVSVDELIRMAESLR